MIWLPQGPAVTRAECWTLGIHVREALVWKHMAEHGLRERPLVKDIVDELIRGGLGARLREEPLPLDRFAQTEVVRGRIEITISTRISEMPRVKDVAGVGYISKWHEIIHVPQDLGCRDLARRLVEAALPGRPAVVDSGVHRRECRSGGRDRRSGPEAMPGFPPVHRAPFRSLRVLRLGLGAAESDRAIPRCQPSSAGPLPRVSRVRARGPIGRTATADAHQ
jgi:hypothetical protein